MRAKICLVITSLLLAVVSIHAQSIWDGKHLERVKNHYINRTFRPPIRS